MRNKHPLASLRPTRNASQAVTTCTASGIEGPNMVKIALRRQRRMGDRPHVNLLSDGVQGFSGNQDSQVSPQG